MDTLKYTYAIKNTIEQIFTSAQPYIMAVDCKFVSTEPDQYEFDLKYFDRLTIDQNFLNGFTDSIQLIFKITGEEYVKLLEHYRSLRCILTFKTVNHVTQKTITPIKSVQYRVIFQDKTDLFKQCQRGDLIPTDKIPREDKHNYLHEVKVQLISESDYLMRKIKLNLIGREVTVNQMLQLLAVLFKVDSHWIVEPDNKKVYTNLPIPPMRDISNVFLPLQRYGDLGVYAKGFNYYVMDNVLYVYPIYDLTLSSPETVHVYKVEENRFPGIDRSFIVNNQELHFISDGAVEDIINVDQNVENLGTSYIIQRGEKLIPSWCTHTELSTTVADNFIFGDTALKGIARDNFNSRYIPSHGNPYVYYSELASHQVTFLQLRWRVAKLWAFRPGWKVLYHYEGDNSYQTRSGNAFRVLYSVYPINRISDYQYGCDAQILLGVTSK